MVRILLDISENWFYDRFIKGNKEFESKVEWCELTEKEKDLLLFYKEYPEFTQQESSPPSPGDS